jgi:uncharacterized metal-binding protein YceD (DUF177 family)
MLKIDIYNLKDGVYPVSETCDSKSLTNLPSEFIGEVKFEGKIRKVSNRFEISGKINCDSILTCDISLESYHQMIESELHLTALQGVALADRIEDDDVVYVADDDKFVDLSTISVETLIIALPMKRVAPQYRDKEFSQLFPEFSADSEIESGKSNGNTSAWDALKNIKIN